MNLIHASAMEAAIKFRNANFKQPPKETFEKVSKANFGYSIYAFPKGESHSYYLNTREGLGGGGQKCVTLAIEIATGHFKALSRTYHERTYLNEVEAGLKLSSEYPVVIPFLWGETMSRKQRCKKYYIITDYYACKDMTHLQVSSFNEAERWILTRDLVEGLMHIHRKGIIHQDIKPENIFLDDQNGIKVGIGDFGVMTKEGFGELVGTQDFWCPEKMISRLFLFKKIEKASDAWSLGLILYSILKDSSFANQYLKIPRRKHSFMKSYEELYQKECEKAEHPIEKLILKLLRPYALNRIPLSIFRDHFMRLFNARTRLTPLLSSADIASILLPGPALRASKRICAEYLQNHLNADMAALDAGSMKKIPKKIHGMSIYLFGGGVKGAFLNTGILLGKGSSKMVTIAIDISTGNLKALAKSFEYEPMSLFPKESPVLQPEVWGSSDNIEPIYYTILPLCDRKDLYDAIAWKDDLSHADKVRIVQDVIEGVLYIHSKGYLYQDLMLENILLRTDAQGLVRGALADLGSIAPLRMPTFSGSKANWAPEKLSAQNGKLTGDGAAMDAWLVGIVLYEVFIELSGYQVVYNEHHHEPDLYIDSCKKRYQQNRHAENPLYVLINELLNPDPIARMPLHVFLEQFKEITRETH